MAVRSDVLTLTLQMTLYNFGKSGLSQIVLPPACFLPVMPVTSSIVGPRVPPLCI